VKFYRIKPGAPFKLSSFDPLGESEYAGNKELCLQRLVELKHEISELQRLLYAEHEKRLLVILQAMDTGGKDGTVRHVFSGIDPHGLNVISFKAPSREELDRDFLWRIHSRVPAKGEITVFNRSHYEDILAVKVKKLLPKSIWEKRYQHIVNFGTTILKFYLHISHDEQRRRLQERLENPKKLWKFDPEDLRDRERWPEFISAYEEVISRTTTELAPWYIIPANKKWYRNMVVAQIVRDSLAKLEPQWPQAKHSAQGIVLE
jgi:PPK2 family polyphosphate:nucleotide phosphotransferase